MKSAQVLETFKRFLDGDRDGARLIIEQIVAHEIRAGNSSVASSLRRLVDSRGQFIRLPDAPSSIAAFHPRRTLDSLVLSSSVRAAVDGVLREWAGRERLIEHGLHPRNVILLHGPSGNGKTALAEAIAMAVGLPFMVAKYDSIIGSLRGETVEALAKLFKYVHRVPCVLLFDEADSLVGTRVSGARESGKEDNRAVNAVLVELDHLPSSAMVIFATNMRGDIDSSLARRIALELEIGPPENGQFERMVSLISERWPFIAGGEWVETAKTATSYAAIESAGFGAAREMVLSGAAAKKETVTP